MRISDCSSDVCSSDLERLLQAGKVRAIGASNHDAAQLAESLAVAGREGLPAYQVLQLEYNLGDRAGFEGPTRDLRIAADIGLVTYYSLASGFLSGTYRPADDLGYTPRVQVTPKYNEPRILRNHHRSKQGPRDHM